jgi:hypothetical protein
VGGPAALREPPLIKDPKEDGVVLEILDSITRSLATARDRRNDEFKVQRQALGYCWSVAAAAAPEQGRSIMEKWLRSDDPDVRWVMKTNLGKARISALGAHWLAEARRGGSA